MDVMTFSLIVGASFFVIVFAFMFQLELMRKRHHEETLELIKLIKAGSLTEYKADRSIFPKSSNYIKDAIRDQYRKDGDEAE